MNILKYVFLYPTLLIVSMASADEYKYDNPFNAMDTVIIDSLNDSMQAGDVEAAAEYCDEDSEFICFISDVSFSIPREGSKPGDKWIHNGQNYRNTGSRTLSIIGNETSGFVIRSEFGLKKLIYIFSYEIGLIAMGQFDKSSNLGKMYLLSGAVGYGGSKLLLEK